MKNNKHWSEITSEEAYRLSQAEFRGATLEALKQINSRLDKLENYNTNSRYISMIIAGITGVVAGVFGGQMK